MQIENLILLGQSKREKSVIFSLPSSIKHFKSRLYSLEFISRITCGNFRVVFFFFSWGIRWPELPTIGKITFTPFKTQYCCEGKLFTRQIHRMLKMSLILSSPETRSVEIVLPESVHYVEIRALSERKSAIALSRRKGELAYEECRKRCRCYFYNDFVPYLHLVII